MGFNPGYAVLIGVGVITAPWWVPAVAVAVFVVLACPFVAVQQLVREVCVWREERRVYREHLTLKKPDPVQKITPFKSNQLAVT
jgi:hypothetical protein